MKQILMIIIILASFEVLALSTRDRKHIMDEGDLSLKILQLEMELKENTDRSKMQEMKAELAKLKSQKKAIDDERHNEWVDTVTKKRDSNISESYPHPTWNIIDSNDVKIMIMTDMLGHGRRFPVFREFHFSADGRLLSISGVKKIMGFNETNILETLSITNVSSGIRNTPARDRRLGRSLTPCASEK